MDESPDLPDARPGGDLDAAIDEDDPPAPHEAGMDAAVTSSDGSSVGKDGGSGSGDGSTGSASQECNDANECDDGNGCTRDVCVEGVCSHSIDAEACDTGQACDPRTGGCVDTGICGDDTDCEDDDPCTRNETCNLSASRCEWDILDSDGDGHAAEACGGDDFDDGAEASFPGAMEVCDGLDNDNNGIVDDGSEATICPDVPEGSSMCVDGECTLVCEPGTADCDEHYGNGCEVDTFSNKRHCGACGYECATCTEDQCGPRACAAAGHRDLHFIGSRDSDGLVTPAVNISELLTPCINSCFGDVAQCTRECVDDSFPHDNPYAETGLTEGCTDCFVARAQCQASCAEAPEKSLEACECEPGCIEAFIACSGVQVPECEP